MSFNPIRLVHEQVANKNSYIYLFLSYSGNSRLIDLSQYWLLDNYLIKSLFAILNYSTINLLLCIIQSFPQKCSNSELILHSMVWLIMISIPLLAKLTHNNGLSLFGFPMAGIILVFFILLISLYTICYFNKAIPDNEKYKEIRDIFGKYYYRWIKGQCIMWTWEAISFTIAGINNSYFQKWFLFIVITIGNSAKLCTPQVLSILRYNEPTIKDQIKRFLRKVWSRDDVQSELYKC